MSSPMAGILPTAGNLPSSHPVFPCHPMSGFLSAASSTPTPSPTSPSALSAAAAAAAALYGSAGAALFPSFCMQVCVLVCSFSDMIIIYILFSV
jgi:hypothetical protein